MARWAMAVVVVVVSSCRSLVPVTEASCSDALQNGEETAVDCGGSVCGPCALPAPTCSDGVLDQDESDVDCGGASCPRCADGKRCVAAADCVSLACENGQCGRAASCTDGAQNGDESSPDCGGALCASCPDGATCRANADCTSRNCGSAFRCLPSGGSCIDQVHNGAETDVDCGGPTCSRCAAGARCQQAGDCLDGLCAAGLCAARPTCSDGLENGDESDVDCGGSTCARCGAGESCLQASDCLERLCSSGACVPRPSCVDGVRNGDESDTDCGGPVCLRCQAGSTCGAATDCFTALCTAGTCARPPGCSDGLRNGDEADVDCGGPLCARCAVGARCQVGSDCLTGRCNDQFLWTDASWKWSLNGATGWSTAGFDDSSWSLAVSEGLHGTGPPWGASPPMPPQTQAHWIWNYDSRNSGDNNTVYFRKTFVGPAVPIELHVVADDRFTAYLNGVSVASGVLWFTPAVVTLTPPPGMTSVLAVAATNGGGTGGLAADARLTVAACAP